MTSTTLSLIFVISQAPYKAATEIEWVLNNYAEATRTYDVKALDKLFDPEYVEVSPLGEVDLRDKVLSFYKQPGPAPDSKKIDELTIRLPAKGFAVAIFRQTANIKIQDKTVSRSFRVTVNLKHSGNNWRMFSTQFGGLKVK